MEALKEKEEKIQWKKREVTEDRKTGKPGLQSQCVSTSRHTGGHEETTESFSHFYGENPATVPLSYEKLSF